MIPLFIDGAVHVRAPATSANLGSGFDTLGLALAYYDEVTASIGREGLAIDVIGEGGALPRDEAHLVVQAMRATFERLGGQPPGLVLTCHNRIPHGRGLGSSAAAIVSGVLLARALVARGAERLDDLAAFAMATELEGHPDNVAASQFGGLTIAWTDEAGAHMRRADVARGIQPVLLIPATSSSTAVVRGLLPASVPHADAAFAVSRTALVTALLTGASELRTELLLAATDDRLHQPYRASAMPATADLVQRLRAAGFATVVSGAGPTVLVLLVTQDDARAAADAEVRRIRDLAPDDWRVAVFDIDLAGAVITPADAGQDRSP